MIVKAKCTARAWDSAYAQEYVPGGGPFGGLYEIDTESPLASLTVVPVAYDENGKTVRYYRDNEGKLKSVPIPKPAYLFEFDRNLTKTDEGVVVTKDYSCKEPKCVGFGMVFKTLNALGNHSHKWHKDLNLIKDDGDEPVVLERRGAKKGARTYTCKHPGCGQVLPNLYSIRVHNKTHVAETESVPA